MPPAPKIIPLSTIAIKLPMFEQIWCCGDGKAEIHLCCSKGIIAYKQLFKLFAADQPHLGKQIRVGARSTEKDSNFAQLQAKLRMTVGSTVISEKTGKA